MKKLFLTLGAAAAAITPLAAVVSCSKEAKQELKEIKIHTRAGAKEATEFVTGTFTEEYTRTTPVKIAHDGQTPSEYMRHYTDGVAINVRIPDWDHAVNFDQEVYDKNPSNYIRAWHFGLISRSPRKRGLIPQMIPFNTVHHFEAAYKDETLGELLDEINAKTHIKYFEWNIEDRSKAGEMGRFLYGVLKGHTNPTEDEHNAYYGINEVKKSYGWIKTSDRHYSYISLSSTTNPLSANVVHDTFDKNESFYTYDYRLPKGCDNIHLKNHDVINLNFWRMM